MGKIEKKHTRIGQEYPRSGQNKTVPNMKLVASFE
ncbi:MAG: hypothetical protein JWP44_2741 [Mucilaginibacter sp.]|nr:hypothetical protein [Mucilaginibacter sp.]